MSRIMGGSKLGVGFLAFGILFAISFMAGDPPYEDLTPVSGTVVISEPRNEPGNPVLPDDYRYLLLEGTQGPIEIKINTVNWQYDWPLRPEDIVNGDHVDAKLGRGAFGQVSDYVEELRVNGRIIFEYSYNPGSEHRLRMGVRWFSITGAIALTWVMYVRRRRNAAGVVAGIDE